MYPVDLPDLSPTDITSSSERYLSALESGRLHKECLELPPCTYKSKATISAPNLSRLQLFDDQPVCVVLALHSSDEQAEGLHVISYALILQHKNLASYGFCLSVLALYLHDRWWHLEDVLRTSSLSRSGLVPVESLTERLVVFLLSQVVEQPSEGEALFALHSHTESCKVLWREGQAVGFYSVKPKGSLLNCWSGACYLLPVLDTVLVRKSCRRRGFGLQMLKDFCSSFTVDETLGVSSPISPSMAAVLRIFLQQHEEHREHLYEVEAPGGWAQRQNIWLNIQLGRYSWTHAGPDPTSEEFSST
ncbi:protein FAM169B isoform X2 [Gouania willdenowi]|uniref:Protein FAM169B-like n=1 Tax=Gouania willdenowi TaxID=441366 RepID=A0A8C5EE48_GOUWI|nr:protein FAM169B-like isoform X2 [Gouania willdenowi]